MANPIEITLERIEILDDQAVSQGLQKQMAAPKGKLKKLDDEAKKRGYKKATGPRAEFGLRHTFKAGKPVPPPAGTPGQPVQEVEVEISLSTLEKPNSEDQAAIGTVRVTAGKNTEEYDMLLEALDGDFEDVRESKVENDKVVPANSWWTAARSCVIGKCGSVCIGALTVCRGTWAAYLLCVAAACGGCWVRCSACATCNCRWWCKWAAGCCRQ